MAELLVKIDPKLYRKYLLTNSKGKPVMYVQLKIALYMVLSKPHCYFGRNSRRN
jgi:hypothetical protein